MTTIHKLNTLALTLLIAGAIDSIRNLPAAALFGPTLIFFCLMAAMLFLIPSALVSAELAANIDEGGIYQWSRLAFGDKVGFMAVWLQWINNVVWFPTILSFIAGTAAYLINPDLAEHKGYLVAVILSAFWLLTLINLKGIHVSVKFTSFCAVAGLIIPMVLIIGMFLIWLILGNPLQIHLTGSNMLPDLSQARSWTALTAIMLGFSGMELASVHIKEVNEPQTTFPKALAFSTMITICVMVAGSLAIAFVLPHDQINLVNGTMQSFAYFLSQYHLNWLIPVLTILLVFGSLGGIISWVVSPIKGLSQAACHGFLPQMFERHNKHGVPQNLLITQAFLVSFTCIAFLFFPSINASYWLLSALSTQLYMFMYVIMFLAAIKLRHKQSSSKTAFAIPGKQFGLWLVCLMGLTGTLMTIGVGFFPPANVNIGSRLNYELVFCGGILLMTLPTSLCYWYKKRHDKLHHRLSLANEPLKLPESVS